ncbi:MAG: hypothetical protein R3Y04_05500, partial [Rikenellaceae bacterium]
MADNLTITNDDYSVVDSQDEMVVNLSFSNNLISDDKVVSLTLNENISTAEFYDDTIVLTLNEGGDGMSDEQYELLLSEIESMRTEMISILEDYLKKEVYYEFITNQNEVSKYITYVESKDILHTSKTFVSLKEFVMFT